MKKIVLALLLVTAFACKSDKKETPSAIDEVEQKGTFVLKINAIIDYDDQFTLLFLEEGQKNISKENSVIVDVLGSNQPQELIFTIKEEVLPTKLFLRFGNDQKAQRISFLATQIIYGENSFSIEKDKFYQFFNPNKFIEFDNENHVAISKEVAGEYNPIFGSRQVLIDKIFYHF